MSTNASRPELKWNRYDAIVAGLVALLAVIVAVWFYLPKGQTDDLTVVISVGGQETERLPLTRLPDAPTRIDGENGYTLWLSLSHDLSDGLGVYVSESDCPTQDCVHTGTITRAGQSIVCLPAQIVIHLEGTAPADGPDVIVG